MGDNFSNVTAIILVGPPVSGKSTISALIILRQRRPSGPKSIADPNHATRHGALYINQEGLDRAREIIEETINDRGTKYIEFRDVDIPAEDTRYILGVWHHGQYHEVCIAVIVPPRLEYALERRRPVEDPDAAHPEEILEVEIDDLSLKWYSRTPFKYK